MSAQPSITVSEGGFELPVVEVLTGRGVVFGKSGSGKSNSIGVIAEELLSQGFPLCIVDADGEHYGLKEEYELLHVGGDDSVDVQVTPDHAEALAEVMLHEDVPVILDVSGYIDEAEADELVERVVTKLFSMEKKTKKPFPVIVEEIHEMVPETKSASSLASTLIRVAKRGRKHGLGIIGASQRPAEVKKSFVTQASWSIWHKLTWSQDTDVVKEVIDREHAEAVQDLDAGQAIITADWMDEVRTVQFRRKHTFDAGATPGLDEFVTPELKGVSDSVVTRLESITQERESEEQEREQLESAVERLQAENRKLEAELDDARSGTETTPEEVERLQDRVDSLRSDRAELEAEVDDLDTENKRLTNEKQDLTTEITNLENQLATFEDVKEHIDSAAMLLGVGGTAPESEVRETIDELEAENQRLRERLQQNGDDVLAANADYLDFVELEPVQDAIAAAKEDTSASPRYVKGTLAAIIDAGGPVSYSDIADRLDLSDNSNVSKAASSLKNKRVIEVDTSGAEYTVDFNVDGIEEIVAQRKKQERTADIMDKM